MGCPPCSALCGQCLIQPSQLPYEVGFITTPFVKKGQEPCSSSVTCPRTYIKCLSQASKPKQSDSKPGLLTNILHCYYGEKCKWKIPCSVVTERVNGIMPFAYVSPMFMIHGIVLVFIIMDKISGLKIEY